MHDVIIVGGGVIGLSIARTLAASGRNVLLLDRGNPRDAASWAAAGMLSAQSETESPGPFFDLCLASARLYPSWIRELHEESGVDPEYADSGLLVLAPGEEALCRLRRMADWQRAAGLKAELLSAEQVLSLEPRLTLPIVGALHMPEDCHVTPRRLLEALTGACAVKRVDIRTGVRVLEILRDGKTVSGVRTATESFHAPNVIIASGVRSAELSGLSPALPLSPRKGQILSLISNPLGFTRMIRWDHAYVVPRRSGELIVGATNEDAGFDRSITPAGVGSLLERVQQLSSHASALPIGEMWTGLRPATPDGLPILGKASIDGMVYATGHYRNGILLAPVTAAAVLALVENRENRENRPTPTPLDAFAPSRFAV
jgi:glycine oxidase